MRLLNHSHMSPVTYGLGVRTTDPVDLETVGQTGASATGAILAAAIRWTERYNHNEDRALTCPATIG